MKSINVSFDYENEHYNLNAKFKYKKGGPEFTNHACNKELTTDKFPNERIIYNHENNVEVQVDHQMNNILNVILWGGKENDCVIAMLGEFDNCKMELKGLWSYGRS